MGMLAFVRGIKGGGLSVYNTGISWSLRPIHTVINQGDEFECLNRTQEITVNHVPGEKLYTPPFPPFWSEGIF